MSKILPDIANEAHVRALIQQALDEDIATGDATTTALVPADLSVEAIILAKQDCTVSGGSIAAAVFSALDDSVLVNPVVPDGNVAGAGSTILEIRGPGRTILTGERTALNFMQRMTGIATQTAEFVSLVANEGCLILDTRKTTPCLRAIEKYAVLCGGGTNHRIGLFDKVMIKDNHRRLWSEGDCGDLGAAVLEARRCNPGLEIEIEVESEEELESALKGQPEWVLLDNMSPDVMQRCVALNGGRAKLEASGGITLANVREAAASGVDAISLGCLTHSAPSIDLSLEISE